MEKKRIKYPWNIEEKDMYNPVVDEYDFAYDQDHNLHVVKTGSVNVHDRAQAYKGVTDIENIVVRMASGDPTAFKNPGVYADVTKMPTNRHEYKAMQEKASKAYAERDVSLFGDLTAEQIAKLSGDDIKDLLLKQAANKKEVNANE